MQFAISIGRGLRTYEPERVANQVVASFKGLDPRALPYRSALVMADALAGHADAIVEALTVATAGNYSFLGGGARDDGQFH